MTVPLHWMAGDRCVVGGELGVVIRIAGPGALVDLESGQRFVFLTQLELVPLPCDRDGADATPPLDGSGGFV